MYNKIGLLSPDFIELPQLYYSGGGLNDRPILDNRGGGGDSDFPVPVLRNTATDTDCGCTGASETHDCSCDEENTQTETPQNLLDKLTETVKENPVLALGVAGLAVYVIIK